MDSLTEVLARQHDDSQTHPLLITLQGAVANMENLLTVIRDVAETSGTGWFDSLLEEPQGFLQKLCDAGLCMVLVVKVQRPMGSSVPTAGCLVYDLKRELACEVILPPEILAWMGDDPKMYANVRLWCDGTLQFIDRVDDQPW